MHDDKNHNTAKRLQQHMIIAKQVAVLLNIHCHSLATHSLLNESICTHSLLLVAAMVAFVYSTVDSRIIYAHAFPHVVYLHFIVFVLLLLSIQALHDSDRILFYRFRQIHQCPMVNLLVAHFRKFTQLLGKSLEQSLMIFK